MVSYYATKVRLFLRIAKVFVQYFSFYVLFLLFTSVIRVKRPISSTINSGCKRTDTSVLLLHPHTIHNRSVYFPRIIFTSDVTSAMVTWPSSLISPFSSGLSIVILKVKSEGLYSCLSSLENTCE